MFMFYFQYVQKRGEIMRSRISKTWPCHLKRAVLLSLLSGLFILPSQINAETSGEEYKDHQIAEAIGMVRKQSRIFGQEKASETVLIIRLTKIPLYQPN